MTEKYLLCKLINTLNKMNKTYLPVLIIMSLIMIYPACKKDNGNGSGIPVFSGINDIVHPPDEFDILLILRDAGSYNARVYFDTNSVWKIERRTVSTAAFWVQRTYPDSTVKLDIASEITLGLEGDTLYTFYASNAVPVSDNNFYIRFRKLPYDYETYPEKF